MMQAINQIPGLNDKQKRYMYERVKRLSVFTLDTSSGR